LNANLLYLQSTPMTEPLLLATTTLGIALLMAGVASQQAAARPELVEGRAHGSTSPMLSELALRQAQGERVDTSPRVNSRAFGLPFALACLTRYEAWPVTAAALGAAAFARWRQGESIRASLAAVARIGLYPAIAIAGFAVFSRVVIGQWFVAGGF